MDWLLWALSVLVALIGGFVLNQLSRRESPPPVVSVYTQEEIESEKKTAEKGLDFLEPAKNDDDNEGEDADRDQSEGPEELVIVSYRLPVKVMKSKTPGKTWDVIWDDPLARNVFADLKVLKSDRLIVKWVGTVPGPDIPRNDQLELEEELEQMNCYPVFLPPKMRQKFYGGFCKNTLWQLFHYVMPQAVRLDTDFGTRWDEVWQAYRAGNMFFSKTVARVNEHNDNMIWIHGYHLLLVPSLVRRRLPKARIGLFVHEPWPSSEVFRSLPARENLLRGMLACDLIGFQTYDYVRHFLSCCKRLLNLDYKSLAGGSIGITYSGRSVAIRISHVGTRSNFFYSFSKSKKVETEMKKIQVARERKKKIMILSVDYMDLTKGPQMKLQSLHRLLKSHPEKRHALEFIQIILPSSNADREEVEKLVKEEIDRICAEFGDDMIKIVRNPPLEQLVAYYRCAQVAIISTFWDGLNLIPYEYTASQRRESPGALIISEFMGCSRSLSGVVRVNPWSIQDVANAIKTAVEMTLAKRQAWFARRYKYVMAHTLEEWACGFLKDLKRASAYNSNLRFVQVGFSSDVRLVGLRSDFAPIEKETVLPVYRKSECRLILLDYDGTLIGESKTGAIPTEQLKSTLRTLCSDKRNLVFILSGRTRKSLFKWFGGIEQLGLCAEKGCFIRWPQHILPYISALKENVAPSRERRSIRFNQDSSMSSWIRCYEPMPSDKKKPVSEEEEKATNTQWFSLCDPEERQWKALAMQIIRAYDERTDGATIEDKEFGIVWKFEGADPDYGLMQARELQKYLKEIIEDGVIDIVIYDDNRILEILPRGINKGLCTSLLIQTLKNFIKEPLFLMAVGDDVSDEKMFCALQNSPILGREDKKKCKEQLDSHHVVTCCVGLKPSNAHYYAHDPEEVREILRELAVASTRQGGASLESNLDDLDINESAGGLAAMAGSGSSGSLGGFGGSGMRRRKGGLGGFSGSLGNF